MELEFRNGKIILDKELSYYDIFVIDFIKQLNKHAIKYIVVSGYVVILFGRPRLTEDMDFLIEKTNFETFKKLWTSLMKKYICLQTSSPDEAYNEYLLNGDAIRFSLKDKPLPNIEFKYITKEHHFYSFRSRIKVILNGFELFIGEIEHQIVYKLYMDSEKDLEDAKFLFNIFDRYIDLIKLDTHLKNYNIEKSKIRKYLKQNL